MDIFKDKLAVVTGGGRGIGRETALGLARMGATVAVIARSGPELDETVDSITSFGRPARAIAADLASEAGIDHVLKVLDEMGTVELLVNNAASVEPLGTTTTLDRAAIQRAFDLNVVAPIFLSARLLPGMIETGWGRIVNISSGIVGRPDAMVGGTVYASTKAALEEHTLNLAAETAETGVTVNAYRPGSVDTEMQAWIRSQDPERIGRRLHSRFMQNRAQGSLVSAERTAAVLLRHMTRSESGQVWDVNAIGSVR